MTLPVAVAVAAAEKVVETFVGDQAKDLAKKGVKEGFNFLKRKVKNEITVYNDPSVKLISRGLRVVKDRKGHVMGQFAEVTLSTPNYGNGKDRTLLITQETSTVLIDRMPHNIGGQARDLNYMNFLLMLSDVRQQFQGVQNMPVVETVSQDAATDKRLANKLNKLDSERYRNALVLAVLSKDSKHPDVVAAREAAVRAEQGEKHLGNKPVLAAKSIITHENVIERSLRHMSRLFHPRASNITPKLAAHAIVSRPGMPDMIELKLDKPVVLRGHTESRVALTQAEVKAQYHYLEGVANKTELTKAEKKALGVYMDAISIFMDHDRIAMSQKTQPSVQPKIGNSAARPV